MLPISLVPVAWLALIGVVLGCLYWVVDEIGDRREAKVWRKINAAIEKTNVDVRSFNELDEKIAAIAEDARKKALASARQVAAGRCPASAEQAQALSRIR